MAMPFEHVCGMVLIVSLQLENTVGLTRLVDTGLKQLALGSGKTGRRSGNDMPVVRDVTLLN